MLAQVLLLFHAGAWISCKRSACVKWCCWAAVVHADAHADTAAAADAGADAASADAGR